MRGWTQAVLQANLHFTFCIGRVARGAPAFVFWACALAAAALRSKCGHGAGKCLRDAGKIDAIIDFAGCGGSSLGPLVAVGLPGFLGSRGLGRGPSATFARIFRRPLPEPMLNRLAGAFAQCHFNKPLRCPELIVGRSPWTAGRRPRRPLRAKRGSGGPARTRGSAPRIRQHYGIPTGIPRRTPARTPTWQPKRSLHGAPHHTSPTFALGGFCGS